MDNKMLSEALISMLGAGNVRTGELMKTHTTFRIGGAADYYVTPQAEKQIADVIAFLKKSDIKYIVIGNGSNILVSDEGFRGVVVELGDGFSDYEFLQDSQDNSDEGGFYHGNDNDAENPGGTCRASICKCRTVDRGRIGFSSWK